MRRYRKKKRQPRPPSRLSQWTIRFLLIIAVLQVVKDQNPHDVVMLLQLLLQKHF